MAMTGTAAPSARLEKITVRFTNPRGLSVLEPLTHSAFAALLRKLVAPGSTKEARTILDRFESAGYTVFLPGVDDEAYRRHVEKSQRENASGPKSGGSFRRPRAVSSKEYR